MRPSGKIPFSTFLSLALFSLLLSHASYSQTYTSVADGDWSNPATWNCVFCGSAIPTAGDRVVINHEVTLTSNQNISEVDIGAGGSLLWDANFVNLTFQSGGYIDITSTGVLSENGRTNANIIFEDAANYDLMGGGQFTIDNIILQDVGTVVSNHRKVGVYAFMMGNSNQTFNNDGRLTTEYFIYNHKEQKVNNGNLMTVLEDILVFGAQDTMINRASGALIVGNNYFVNSGAGTYFVHNYGEATVGNRFVYPVPTPGIPPQWHNYDGSTLHLQDDSLSVNSWLFNFSYEENEVIYDRIGYQEIEAPFDNAYWHLTLGGWGRKISVAGDDIVVSGNLTIEDTATLEVAANPVDVHVAGDWSQQTEAAVAFFPATDDVHKVELNGTANQAVSGDSLYFYDLWVTNKNGSLRFGDDAEVERIFGMACSNCFMHIENMTLTVNSDVDMLGGTLVIESTGTLLVASNKDSAVYVENSEINVDGGQVQVGLQAGAIVHEDADIILGTSGKLNMLDGQVLVMDRILVGGVNAEMSMQGNNCEVAVGRADGAIVNDAAAKFEVGPNAGFRMDAGELKLMGRGATNYKNVLEFDPNGSYGITGGTILCTETGSVDENYAILTNGVPIHNLEIKRPTANADTVVLASNIDINGDLTIHSGVLDAGQGFDYQINLAGNWIQNGGAFLARNDTVVIDGKSQDQLIGHTNPLQYLAFYALEVDKGGAMSPAPTIELTSKINIDRNLSFVEGVIHTTEDSILRFLKGSTVMDASDSGHVVGPIQRVGQADFLFPTGDGENYRPIGVEGVTAGSNDSYRAEYFRGDPTSLYGDGMAVGIDHVSSCEYWMLTQASGTPTANVVLTWDETSCGVDDMGQLLVTRWDGANWRDEGNGGTTGTPAQGAIITSGTVSNYSPFTLASYTAANPLPVSLVDFDAKLEGDRVVLEWATHSETNNRSCTIERSKEGLHFEKVVEVEGAGNSSQKLTYNALDLNPLYGLSYYRLKQNDFDGTSTHYGLVPINYFGNEQANLEVYPNPFDGSVFSLRAAELFGEHAEVSLKNAMGGIVFKQSIDLDNGNINATINTGMNLPSGVYYLTVQTEDKSFSERLVVRH